MEKHQEALKWLLRAYGTSSADDEESEFLNTRLRRSLRQHASAARLHYAVCCLHSCCFEADDADNIQQDNLGNIYITRSGREPEIASIALGFPLDGGQDAVLLAGAFTLFSLLGNDDLVCPVTLVGWTSIGKDVVGRRAWHSSAAQLPWIKDAATHDGPKAVDGRLDQFSGLPGATEFPLSAIFEIATTKSEKTQLSGAPVLVDKARKHAEGEIEACVQPKASRAPELRIEGADAEAVARATICDYSNYVAALFDNFD